MIIIVMTDSYGGYVKITPNTKSDPLSVRNHRDPTTKESLSVHNAIKACSD